MEYLAKVWDGSKGEVGDNLGFWGCMAVACESGGRRRLSSRTGIKESGTFCVNRKICRGDLYMNCKNASGFHPFLP